MTAMFETAPQAVEWIEGLRYKGEKNGLANMRALLARLGNPQDSLRMIHVAGTNGKGSTCAMLERMLRECGYKTGLYTSPYLMRYHERMRVNGRPIGDEPLVRLASRVREEAEALLGECVKPTTFELGTALALAWFAEEQVDAAVIEVGLGGRLDSTNILEKPELCIITSIGLDHMALLGNTVPEIAAEKAGIFKPGVPALIGDKDPQTTPVFEQKAYMFCPLHYAADERPSLWNRSPQILSEMDLQAEVQAVNLRTVLVAVDLLKDTFEGLKDAEAVADGLIHTARNMDFRGRWERLSAQPYVLADIGHNAHALSHNFTQLERYVNEGRFSSLIIVYGIMADKDLDAILPLMPVDATYIFASPASARSLPASELLRRFNEYRRKEGLPCRSFFSGSVREAVQMATQLAQNLSTQLSRSASAQQPAPPLIYIGGSAFVVAEALPLFK